MNRRFFSEQPVAGDSIQLSAAESQHLVQVLRAECGDRITVFDGSGREFEAEITQLKRSSVTLSIVAGGELSREADRRLVLGVALPKGDRQRWLVEKCVELGVHGLVPLVTRRGVAAARDSVLARLERTVVEASKQCGRNLLMEIGRPCQLDAFLRQPPSTAIRWLAHPGGSAAPETLPAVAAADGQSTVYAAVGPEGGFDPGEVQAAVAHGWTCIRLTPTTLRVETAAMALAAYWLVRPQ